MTDVYGTTLGPGANFLAFGISLLVIISMWRIFTKAGKPGWAAIVPIYNIVVYLQIINRPLWWILLFFVPVVNFIVAIIMVNDLSKSFGKGTGYTVGLIFLGIIFYPMLAFGGARYEPIMR